MTSPEATLSCSGFHLGAGKSWAAHRNYHGPPYSQLNVNREEGRRPSEPILVRIQAGQTEVRLCERGTGSTGSMKFYSLSWLPVGGGGEDLGNQFGVYTHCREIFAVPSELWKELKGGFPKPNHHLCL